MDVVSRQNKKIQMMYLLSSVRIYCQHHQNKRTVNQIYSNKLANQQMHRIKCNILLLISVMYTYIKVIL